jgi:lipoate-protein ligase A
VSANPRPLVRWWVASSPAVVLGLGLRQRRSELIDPTRCARAGIEILERRAGGGAVLVDDQMVCGAICLPLPDARAGADLTESYRWLGATIAGLLAARRVDVGEARADVAALRAAPEDPVAALLLATCYGALSPHEVVDARGRKIVGLAQVRTRHAALFQVGILLRDQSPLADLLRVPAPAIRDRLRAALAQRTGPVSRQSASAAVAAIGDATPSAR